MTFTSSLRAAGLEAFFNGILQRRVREAKALHTSFSA
jgi:hypothetical protein